MNISNKWAFSSKYGCIGLTSYENLCILMFPYASHLAIEGKLRMTPPPLKINAQYLKGNWQFGWALDLHTIASVARSRGGFDTQRTELGEMLYRLKYRYDRSMVEPLAAIAANFLRTRYILSSVYAIIPVPPSDIDRPFQPVEILATRVGEIIGKPVLTDYLLKIRPTHALKEIEDVVSRRQELDGAFVVRDASLASRHVFLFDDLYRSGETLRAITKVLYTHGKIARVYVLTVTKTRSKR